MEAAVQQAAQALGHPVSLALASPGRLTVAVSAVGSPRRMRVAFLDGGHRIVGRVGCPPLVPSRPRPVVACIIELLDATHGRERVLVAGASSGVVALRLLLAAEEQVGPVPVGEDGLAAARLAPDVAVIAVDALDARGEPVGRLLGTGVSELTLTAGKVGGRLGTSHGMAAGFGAGFWVDDVAAAELEAGYALVLPTWMPDGLVAGAPHVEPDTSYPSAPPMVAVAWHGEGDARVLLRQAPAPLAAPDLGSGPAEVVEIAGVRGIARGRWLPTVVWETDERAFGLQLRRIDGGIETALRIAASIPAAV